MRNSRLFLGFLSGTMWWILGLNGFPFILVSLLFLDVLLDSLLCNLVVRLLSWGVVNNVSLSLEPLHEVSNVHIIFEFVLLCVRRPRLVNGATTSGLKVRCLTLCPCRDLMLVLRLILERLNGFDLCMLSGLLLLLLVALALLGLALLLLVLRLRGLLGDEVILVVLLALLRLVLVALMIVGPILVLVPCVPCLKTICLSFLLASWVWLALWLAVGSLLL